MQIILDIRLVSDLQGLKVLMKKKTLIDIAKTEWNILIKFYMVRHLTTIHVLRLNCF